MKTQPLTDLGTQIEQLIQEHVAVCRQIAQDALLRAFGVATPLPPSAAKQGTPTKPANKLKNQSPRRTRVEIEAVSEKFYEAVKAHPGETMTFLASTLDIRATDLHRPMDLLRQAKRIRSVGQRHHTRYYPMCEADAAA